MARPNALQFLKRGMILAGKVFPRFVETWNWLVGAVDSFCGDADVNPNQGYISVDRANPDRPIIRFDFAKVLGQLGNSSWKTGRFSVADTSTPGTFVFENPYYNVGGHTYEYEEPSISGITDAIIALRIPANTSTPQPSLESYSTFSGLREAQADLDYYTIPLYKVEDKKIVVDLRIGPDAAMGEF